MTGKFLLCFALVSILYQPVSARDFYVFVGTYTSGKSEGIYVYRLEVESGKLSHVSTAAGVVEPSYLAIDPQQRFLYAVNETLEFNGKPGGAISAFSIDKQKGTLTLLNQKPAQGGAPCYVAVDNSSQWVLVANYMSGNVAIFPVQPDGKLGEASDVAQHTGAGTNPARQEGPHAHCIVLDAANNYAFAADLGIDKILIYKLDRREGKLMPNDTPWISTQPGDGPRHFIFHPNGKLAFAIQELTSRLTSYAYDAAKGSLAEIQTVPALPEGFSGENTCADIHVSPSGKFLYGSNRGHDSIVIYAIDENSGKLSYVGHEPTQGKTPRNFAIDPTGTYLLAANQKSDTIVTFRIHPDTGKLAPTGHIAEVPTPVCLKLIPVD